MNPRIRELIKQVGCDILFNDDGSGIAEEDGIFFDVESFEKFAELIVKACVEDCRDMFMVGSVSWNLLNEKLDHFGVEE